MKANRRNEEIISTSFTIDEGGLSGGINIDITPKGNIIKNRKGFNTFGEMVHVLWDINKRARKEGWTSDYTIRLPLKGTKPVYKKTINH